MMRYLLIDLIPGLIGGVVGGIAGYFLVYWISRQGFYAPVLPGALAGLGCGLASRTDSTLRGILCAIEAVIAGLVTEWIVFYRPAEMTFANFQGFLGQFPQEPMVTKLLLALGVFLGFWWGRECTLRGRLIRPKEKPIAD
jgi:hypothetical protein